MNAEETSKVLAMISAHYWGAAKAEGKDLELMTETWMATLGEIPLTPYIERALSWWFKHEKWPPQAADLAERAKMYMRHERDAKQSAETMALYSGCGPRKTEALPPLAERRETLRKLVAYNQERIEQGLPIVDVVP